MLTKGGASFTLLSDKYTLLQVKQQKMGSFEFVIFMVMNMFEYFDQVKKMVLFMKILWLAV